MLTLRGFGLVFFGFVVLAAALCHGDEQSDDAAGAVPKSSRSLA